MTLRMMWLRRVDVFGAAKIMAVASAIVALIIWLIGMIVALSATSAISSIPGIGSNFRTGVFAALIVGLFLYPILGAIFGFIAGAIYAFLFNLAAGWIGPLELEVDVADGYVQDAPEYPRA